MARPSTDQLKQGLLLAFVAAGMILAILNWSEALSGTNEGTKNFYRPTYVAPTAMPSTTITSPAAIDLTAPATGSTPAPAPGTPTPTRTVVPNVDDNG